MRSEEESFHLPHQYIVLTISGHHDLHAKMTLVVNTMARSDLGSMKVNLQKLHVTSGGSDLRILDTMAPAAARVRELKAIRVDT